MSTEPPISLMTLVDRLSKLEGLLIGLQNSIVQGQSQTSAFMARVERLEQRQVELERTMVTSAEIQSLIDKVDSLVASDARNRGGTAMASWSVAQLAQWAVAVAAILTLVGVGINHDGLRPAPTTSEQHQ